METKELSHEIADYGLDSDGLLSWEEFYGSSHEDLVESLLEMYDLLIGRSSGINEDLVNSRTQIGFEKSPFEETTKAKDVNKEPSLDIRKNNADNWCDVIEQNWNCRCIEKSAIEPITRCAACDSQESTIRSTDIRESQISKSETLRNVNSTCQSEPSLFQDPSKCELVTCPAGFSTPSTPVQQRIKRLVSQLPLSFKRSESYFRWVTRPSSVSSLASSSSSSSSASSCSGTKRPGAPNKSSTHLASIESLEDDSDTDRETSKDKSSRFSKETGGSEDSGVHSLCTSLPQDKPKYCDPHLSYMDKVVTEIIETEEVYVGDLRKIIEGYLMKWRSVTDFPLRDRLDVLFGNIETVFSFNSLFLKELKQCGLDPVKVARCFVKNNAGFSVYTEYCTNYPKTVSLLTELMRQEGTVRLFRERQAALQHTLPLGSYLLKPVQRILKYHLLLQNIVKQYSNGIEGYKDIVDALRTMTEIAQHINDMKRRHEHEVRVQEIQSLLLGWEGEDLTTFGELCAEGAFRMYGAKALRHVFLFDKMLLVTKKKEGGILDYKTHINCSNLMLIESVPGEPLSFHVIPFDNPRLQYTLQCRNLEQKREWTWQIKRVILENYNAVIPSHARQLVMELGQSKGEDDVQTNKILPKRHHLAPEYLEKRKQERRKMDSSFKCRRQRNKKLETGSKSEDQFTKSTTTDDQTHSNVSENETDDIPLLNEKEENADSSEKLEIKTLEQIVTQILKQNREFDKILKRQKHIISRSRDLSSKRKKKKETNFRGGKTVHETLKHFLRSTQDDTSATQVEAETSFNSEQAASLNEVYEADGPLDKRDFRRSQSFTHTESSDKFADDFRNISLDDDGIPTSPSVWLRQQVQHLPVAPKKAGSLPRSFQISSESSQNDLSHFRDFKATLDRPFTIASDKITSAMLFEGMERFYRGHFRRSNSSTTEDGSLTDGLRTPGASLDHINIHPEYKIYRSGLSASIVKNILSSLQNKLSHGKLEGSQKSESDKKVVTRERKAGRVLYMLAKHYQRTLRNKYKGRHFENDSDPYNQLVVSTYKQGSESLGARLANFTETECRINRLRCSKKAAALLGLYTDTVFSLHSTPKSTQNSSVAEKPDDLETSSRNSVNTIDSFYEKRLEEMDEELSKAVRLQDEEVDGEKCEDNQNVDQKSPTAHAEPNREVIIDKMAERSRDLNMNLDEINEEDLHTSSAFDPATVTQG